MIKKSRLRTQKKEGRRVILSLLILAILGAVGYQLEQHFGIATSVQGVLHSIRVTFSQKGPVRGTIYDRNLKQLAVNLERVSVYVRSREIDSIAETATRLSEVLALDKNKLEEQLESGVLRLWIAEDISQEQEIAVKKQKLPGVYLQRDEKRYYPNDSQAAYIIGAVENSIGLSGVEYYYDRLLAGKNLKLQGKKPPLGSSFDLVLTIDLKIQEILENLVRDIARSEKADKVAMYLLESETGEIIGGANLPGFNPNTYAKYSQEQTEDLFFEPLSMPGKYRLFLRDATMVQAYGEDRVSPAAWSLIPNKNSLGNQLRIWEWLGLEDSQTTDFHVPAQSKKTAVSQQLPVVAAETDFNFVPESATPLNLLRTISMLLDKGKNIHPFAVKKILDKETGTEVLLSEKEPTDRQSELWSDFAGDRTVSLFQSQARPGKSNSYFFRDDILVSIVRGGVRQFAINDMLFVTLPAGSHDLHMLIVVQKSPEGVSKDGSAGKVGLEQLVEEKVERLSVLQQIARSVADVREPEVGGENNYQPKSQLVPDLSTKSKSGAKDIIVPGIMPDLRGLSLRKSLRLLQGTHVVLKIHGTGKVVDQKPRPGTSLKGIKECVLIMVNQEDMSPEKISRGQSAKK